MKHLTAFVFLALGVGAPLAHGENAAKSLSAESAPREAASPASAEDPELQREIEQAEAAAEAATARTGTPGGGGATGAEVFGPDESLASPPPPASPEEAIRRQPVQLVELFSVEENPGGGRLSYQKGEYSEEIVLGKETGLYGIGMVFAGSKLPDQYGQDFARDTIVQVAFGRLKSAMAGQLPQFCAATLIGERLPDASGLTYPIIIPRKGQKNPMKNLGLLLFASPSTPNDQSDEQKLKGTFFAQSGNLILRQIGKPRMVDVRHQGQNLKFRLHLMETEVNLVLGTPFNAEKASLLGTVQIPVYSPYGGPAMDFTQRIAGESLEGPMNLSGGLSPPSRGLSSGSSK